MKEIGYFIYFLFYQERFVCGEIEYLVVKNSRLFRYR